jgi:hypothetical protein
MWMLRCGCFYEVEWVFQLRWQRGSPTSLTVVRMGSLYKSNIGAAGARDLGAALLVNTTLTTLE